jgi:hypothetical protein
MPPRAEGETYADRREQFERLSNNAPANPDAEIAFLASKVGLIRGDPNLSGEEKDQAIAELEHRIRELTQPSENPSG